MHHGVRLGLGGTAHGTRHRGGVSTHRKLVFHQFVHAALIHYCKNNVGLSAADLQSDAPALHSYRCGRAPSVCRPAYQNISV